jgi:hypothetical protein
LIKQKVDLAGVFVPSRNDIQIILINLIEKFALLLGDGIIDTNVSESYQLTIRNISIAKEFFQINHNSTNWVGISAKNNSK